MKLSSLAIIIFLLTNFSLAQGDWKIKNFETWTKQDVDTILNKSNWAKSQEVRLSNTGQPTQVAGAVNPNVSETLSVTTITGGISPTLDFVFTVRLRSSMAIRLAIIRKNQLEIDTSKLSKEELDLFNKKQRGLFDCPACVENYVVSLSSKSRENKNFDAVFTSFNNSLLADLKRYIYLQNDKGEKRELVHFVAPKVAGEEAVFFFRRFDEKQNQLFTKDSKQIVLNFTNNEVNSITNFKIDVKPIIVGEKVDF